MKDDWTLTVEQILYTISHAERWRTVEKGMKALRNVNKLEKDIRKEQRRLQNSKDENTK